jgi:formate-dependent nitrite reductase membrane component NrfD
VAGATVNAQMQREWGWWIAIYLFLGGIGGGGYTIGAANRLVGEGAEASTMFGLWIGFPALAIGSICLLADLGSPPRVFLGLVGGVILRQSFLVCGALPTLSIGGFEFRRIARPKDPKPGIGLMPPV